MANIRAILNKVLGTADSVGGKEFINLLERELGVDTITELRAIPIDNQMKKFSTSVLVRGGAASYDWNPRYYKFNIASVAADDGDAVIAPVPDKDEGRWESQITGPEIGALPVTTTPALASEVAVNEADTLKRQTLRQVREAYLTTEKTTDFTFDLTHGGATVPVNSASQVDATIPTNASVPFPIGTILSGLQTGLGFIRFLAAAGVVVHMPKLKNSCSLGKGARVRAEKINTDEWFLSEDLDFPILQGFADTVVWAFGMVQLVPAYNGPVMKARESGANVDLDLYLDSNHVLDNAQALAHAAGNSLYADTWYSQEGTAANNALQATDANQPQLLLDGANGSPCLEGDAVSQQGMQTTAVPIDFSYRQRTVCALARVDADAADDQQLWSVTRAGGSNNLEHRIVDGSGLITGFASITGGTAQATGSIDYFGSGYHSFIWVNKTVVNVTKQVDLYNDADPVVSSGSSASSGGAALDQGLAIMKRGNNSNWLDGRMAACFCLDNDLGVPEIQLIRQWQMALAGI